jgi:NADH-ubiquinone oxidoreductase chain 5
MMVVGIGLSSYNIALFHLINHAFYKALLFLGAGSVIHAVADNQDLRKYGGLIKYLPLTYSVMLIASLSLVAFPFMTGFYSKDFILESAYGQFSFSGAAGYIIATIGAIFTTLYSVKVLYLTFLANPNGTRAYYRLAIDNLFSNPQNYKPAHEGDFFLTSPLIILALFSIFFGFITKDIFIGMGSNLFVDNSLFIHPIHEIMIDTEFGVPVLFKLLPFIFTISFSVIALTLSELLSELVINFKLSRLGYNIFGFFNQRFLIEFFYNKYITNLILNLGGQITKVLDKGSIELFGPFGLEKGLVRLSKNISSLSTSHVTSYALYILIGLVLYLLYSHLLFNLPLILAIILLLMLIAGDDESNAETSPITSPRYINYYDNKLKKNPQIYIYNNKMMFSTSTPLFNSDSPEENPEPSDSNSEDNDSDDEEARAKRMEYWEKVDEREELGREYKRLNDIDSQAEDAREREYGSDDGSDEYITEEMRRAKQALIDKTEEFKSKDHEVKEAKEAYEKMTGKTLPEPE